MLVLDTTSLPACDRAEVFQSMVSENASSSVATFDDPSAFHARMHVYDLGPGRIFNVEASGNTLCRTAQMARAADECAIALALPRWGRNRMVWDGGERLLGPRDLLLVDLAATYRYGWSGQGTSYAFQVDVDRLAVPMDIVRRAARRLHESPLYDLVRDHIATITIEAERVTAESSASHLGTATVDLMRALVLSAGGDEKRRREAMHASVAPRVQRYIAEHLADPDLSPRQIAAANGVSLRSLYALYASLETSLEQTILRQRLDGARGDLSAPSARHLTITSVAAAWGFTNLSHFSKRFRQAYGVTPREWRTTAQRRSPD